MQGTDHQHIMGVLYAANATVIGITGQTAMFWLDVLVLTQAMASDLS